MTWTGAPPRRSRRRVPFSLGEALHKAPNLSSWTPRTSSRSQWSVRSPSTGRSCSPAGRRPAWVKAQLWDLGGFGKGQCRSLFKMQRYSLLQQELGAFDDASCRKVAEKRRFRDFRAWKPGGLHEDVCRIGTDCRDCELRHPVQNVVLKMANKLRT